ncbi:MAG: hypothetical protein Q7T83_05790 [Thermodesulfovibrionales bacterium]|nr:hypothetical protein [Thermodesulfovibrionales bacterium]
MSVDTLKIYEILSASLPEAQAKAVAKAINIAIEADTERKKELLATKEDLANLRAELKEDIANVKADIIKWMFIFWLGQIGVLTGIIFAMLKLYFK